MLTGRQRTDLRTLILGLFDTDELKRWVFDHLPEGRALWDSSVKSRSTRVDMADALIGASSWCPTPTRETRWCSPPRANSEYSIPRNLLQPLVRTAQPTKEGSPDPVTGHPSWPVPHSLRRQRPG